MKTYQYIALAVLALGMAACTQEDDFIPQGNQKGAPITIASVGVANLATRATIEDDKLVEGNIGVTITSTGNDDRYKGSNVNWYGSNGVWGLVENQKVVLYEGNGESQKVYAYYPYAKDIIEGTENLPVTLPETFGSNFEGYDYLCTKEGISLSQNPVSLTLSHAFSKVSVSVNVMGNELEGDVVTEIALANVPLNGERSATTGAIDPDKYGPANGRIALYGYDDEDYDEVADYYIGYALPNAATTLDLRVTMQSGRVFTAKAPISGGMTDGVHYKIGLNLGKDKLEVRTVTVAPWGTGGAIEGGVAEEVYPNIINATAMDATALNEAVVNALELEYTDLTVTLAAEPESEMYAAIRRALIDTEGVVDGSINLTLKGATVMPDHSIELQDGSIAFGEIWQDENGETLNNPEQVLELHSISLPDMLTIGEGAFEGCGNLTSINAPKVQTIGKYALSKTALTSVEFPELKTITTNLLGSTNTLTSARFPKVTTIENAGLMIGYSFNPESVSLELTAEDDITFNGNNHFNVESQNYSTKVDLVLHSNKQDEVTDGNQWKGYTFKSITFKD